MYVSDTDTENVVRVKLIINNHRAYSAHCVYRVIKVSLSPRA